MRRGGESTALIVMAIKNEANDGFGNNDGSIQLLVGSGESEHYLDDHPGLRGQLSDYARLEETREITTAGPLELNGVQQEPSAVASSTRPGFGSN